ncbi:MAG: DUF167 domain-containing protein [Patescibacteria group bacterium]
MHLQIKVIPRAKKTEYVATMSDGTLKIRLKAVPEKGRANEELIRFLAESLHVHQENIEIISGFSDARKLVRIPDLITLPW